MQRAVKAVYMRGGTSKGVFFRDDWLPSALETRDRVLLRVIGSPDPYGQHIDGMGGATSSTSNLTSAVGPFAIAQGLVKTPKDGFATIRIWQVNIQAKT